MFLLPDDMPEKILFHRICGLDTNADRPPTVESDSPVDIIPRATPV